MSIIARNMFDYSKMGINEVDKWGRTPLFLALCNKEGVDSIKALLTKGADPNMARATTLECPLHRAVNNGDLEVVQVLLDAGADPTATDKNGYTPMDMSGPKGSIEIIEALVKAGATIQHINPVNNNTILHMLSGTPHVKTVEYCLRKGADPTIANIDGDLPQKFARSAEMIRLLDNPPPAEGSPPPRASPAVEWAEVLDWLLAERITTTEHAATVAKTLAERGRVVTVARLLRKALKGGAEGGVAFFNSMGLDDDEAEDAVEALQRMQISEGASKSTAGAVPSVVPVTATPAAAVLAPRGPAAPATAAAQYLVGESTPISDIIPLQSLPQQALGRAAAPHLLQGSFADHLGRRQGVVIKLARAGDAEGELQLQWERAVLGRLTGLQESGRGNGESGCIRIFPWPLRATSVYMISQQLGGGTTDLGRYLTPDCAVSVQIMQQLLQAVAALHGLGVMHGDIKPANVLVTLDVAVKVTLCDLESARYVKPPPPLPPDSPFAPLITEMGAGAAGASYPQTHNLRLTAAYAAPEVVEAILSCPPAAAAAAAAPAATALLASEAIDMFSVGLVCAALLSTQVRGDQETASPLPPRARLDQLDGVGNEQYMRALRDQAFLQQHLRSVCDRRGVGAVRFVDAVVNYMCCIDASRRWTAHQVLQHYAEQSVTRVFNQNTQLTREMQSLANMEKQFQMQPAGGGVMSASALRAMLEETVAKQFGDSRGLLQSEMQSLRREQQLTRDMVLEQVSELRGVVEGLQQQLSGSMQQMQELLRRVPDLDIPHLFVLLPVAAVGKGGGVEEAGDGATGEKKQKHKSLLQRMTKRSKHAAASAVRAVRHAFQEECVLFFLSTDNPHQLAVCGPDGKGYPIRVTRAWVRRALPVVRVALLALQLALTTYGIPLPLLQLLPGGNEISQLPAAANPKAAAGNGNSCGISVEQVSDQTSYALGTVLESAGDQLEAVEKEVAATALDDAGVNSTSGDGDGSTSTSASSGQPREVFDTLVRLLAPRADASDAETRQHIRATCGLRKCAAADPGHVADWVVPM